MSRGLRIGIALGVVLAIPVIYVGTTFLQVWSASRQDSTRPAGAIVVFGAAQYDGRPSRVLSARLDHAVELWRRGLAPLIVVTGGGQPGDRFTEATASADYLHARGVPDAVILREVKGRSSWQSLAAAAAFLRRRQVHRVLLVSDPFHSFRIMAMAAELGLDGRASPTRSSPIRGLGVLRHLGRETVAVAVGRIIGYRRESGVRAAARSG